MKFKFIFLFLIISQLSIAQKEDHKWLFGFNVFDVIDPILRADTTRGASEMDFNFDPVKIYYAKDRVIDFSGTNASISDQDGNLLAYSNGQVIYNGKEKPICDTINYHIYSTPEENRFCSEWEANNLGPSSVTIPTGNLGFQSVYILPMEDKFFAVYNTFDYCTRDYFKLSYTEFSLDEDQNATILAKDVMLLEGDFSGPLYSVRHGNGRDWWVFQVLANNYEMHQFLITPKGMKYVGLRTVFSNVFPNNNGQFNMSPDGTRFVLTSLAGTLSAPIGTVSVFNFDRCTGFFSKQQRKYFPKLNHPFGTGVCFSPDSRRLYVSDAIKIFQYDASSSNLFATEQVIAEYDGFVHCLNDNPTIKHSVNMWYLNNSPDGKIYIAPTTTTNKHLGVINYPNEEGIACDVRQHSVVLPTEFFRTMPSFPHYRLGPDDGCPCDTLGLDNHPIAKFRYEPDSVQHKKIRFTDLSYFRPETWRWDFGDGSPQVIERYPFHTYSANGTYEVCLTVSNENSSNTTCRTVTIGTSSSDDAKLKADITLFPNPVSDMLQVTLGEYIPENGKIHIYDTTGRQVLSQRLYYGHNHIDMSHLQPGLYLWTAEDDDVKIKSGKVVVVD